MSTPNDYVPATQTFHHENVTPLVIQAAHSNSNFAAPTNANGATHFNGSGFFLNSNTYDMTVLPLFHHTPQRAANFSTTSFAHQKPTQPDMPKEDLLQMAVDNRSNAFGADSSSPTQSVYWSRQSQLSPFGVLPHEITSDHAEGRSTTTYDNAALNTHFVSHTLNSLNQLSSADCDKKTAPIMPAKAKEPMKKQYIQKPMTEVKLNAPVYNNHEEMNFRNGVINHSGQVVKLDHNKLIGTMYKTKDDELQQPTESLTTVPRDYRVFKSPGVFPGAPAPVVKYTGKPSKQYVQKQLMKTQQQRLSSNGSPLMQQKIDFQEDGQSSPISLTSDDLNEQHRYSSPSNVTQHSMKDGDVESTYLNHMNAISHTNSPAYREQPPMPDPSCHDKTKVTSSFLKLPYTVANVQNNVVAEACHTTNRKAPFAPLYIMYNNAVSTTNHAAAVAPPKRAPEKPMGAHNERQETHQHPQVNKQNIPHTGNAGMVMSKPQQNGLIGYPSVIMRTERNYESDEKSDKRRMQWPNERPIQSPVIKQPDNKLNHVQPSLNDHQQILLGLTERQHSYFDSPPCAPQLAAQPMNNNVVKCSPKVVPKTMYEESRAESQPHHQLPPNQDHMNPYQQYVQPSNKSPMPMNATPVQQHAEVTQKGYRKRKSSKTINMQQHIAENRVPTASMTTDYQNRDPPPAHLNVYQQPTQNTNYVMDGVRYDMSKMYSNSDQFYTQSNMNYNAVANVMQDTHQQQEQQQPQTVIALHTAASTRLSPSANPQLRPMAQMPPSLPLSTYFSSFHSPSPHYPEYSVNSPDTGQSYNTANGPPSASSSSSSFHENNAQREKEIVDSRPRVVVPNIEEEFKFLFDPHLPNFKLIAGIADEEEMAKLSVKPTFYRKNIDFLASYKKFLDNNCESTETLIDSNPSMVKSWSRTKVMYQPINREKEEPIAPAIVPKEPIKTVTKEPECNFENDPRYYPLPKSSDKRRLDSSSEDESDELTKKASKTSTVGAKKAAVEVDKKKATIKKEKKLKGENEAKRKEQKKEAKKEEKLKTKKLEKVKKKEEKVRTKPAKATKTTAPINALKQPAVLQQKKSTKETSKDVQKSIPRRKVAERKAKDDVKSRIKGAMDSEDEFHSSSDGEDPSWTPKDDDNENSTKRRSTRIRSVRFKTKSVKKLSNDQNFKRNFQNNPDTKKENRESVTELTKAVKKSNSSSKSGQFYVLKSEANSKQPTLWRLKGDKLHKFEHLEQNGRHLFGSASVSVKLSKVNLGKYQEVEATIVEKSKDQIIVELCDEIDIPTDTKIKENFMKESLCYEHQFAVYIQTLVSQALDSNFLSEIVKENDVYFLSNMKVIDDVTTTYLVDLSSVVKWGTGPVDVLVKTWPFISIKNIRTGSTSEANKCASCSKTNAKQTAIFYGQPYQRDTLQGCKSNSIPNDLDKTIDLCGLCAREIKLFNRIWHQKYQVFVECAKYVSKKKGEDKSKGTTDILNELLADTGWLSKLYYDIRNIWLQIWTIVRKTKES